MLDVLPLFRSPRTVSISQSLAAAASLRDLYKYYFLVYARGDPTVTLYHLFTLSHL